MRKCVRCGTENPDLSRYCDECGSPLEKPLSRDEEKSASEAAFAGAPRELRTSWRSNSGNLRTAGSNLPERNGSQTAVVEGEKFAGTLRGKLTIERGKSAGKEFLISAEETQIGRWDADNGIFPDIDLDAHDPEAKVSRRHAKIIREGELFLIEDLGSTNGTFINRGRRLLSNDRQILNNEDEIIVGKTFLRFKIIQ